MTRYDTLTVKLPYVGGAFAINEYKRLLVNSYENSRDLNPGDETGPSPMWIAVDKLPSVVQSLTGQAVPTINNRMSQEQAAQLWLDWLDNNELLWKDSLPTGVNMKYSESACQTYLKRELDN